MADAPESSGRNTSVALGCGTWILMILLAFIVANGVRDELRKEIELLRGEVRTLNDKIDHQQRLLESIAEPSADPPTAPKAGAGVGLIP